MEQIKSTKEYTFLDLAEEVLEKTKTPMTYREIWKKSEKEGLDKKMTRRITGTNSESSMSERMGNAVINRSETFVKVGKKNSVTLFGLTKFIDLYKSANYGDNYTIEIEKRELLIDYLKERYEINDLETYKFEFNRKNGRTQEAHIDVWLKATDEEKLEGSVQWISYWGWRGKSGKRVSAKYKVGDNCLSFVCLEKNKWLLVSAGEIIDVPKDSHAKFTVIEKLKPLFGKLIVECIVGENYVVNGSTIVNKCLFSKLCDELYNVNEMRDDKSVKTVLTDLNEKKLENGEDENGGKAKENYPLNQILYGPPGTGKTYNSIIRAVAICEGKKVADVEKEPYADVQKRYKELEEQKRIAFVTFHQSYGYEEFIQGIKPLTKNGQVEYKVEPGVFARFCDEAKDKKENYVFIIDEINRGNVSKIFGELITLIEESKRICETKPDKGMTVKLPYKDENGEDVVFGVPDNVYLLGTMNTADRSLVQLDTALRRRFRFIEMMPDCGLLKQKVKDEDGNELSINLNALLTAINERICALIDREHQIGHSYFMKVESLKDLRDTFQYEIIPLLQEYFYENYKEINRVLNNNGFIAKKDEWKYMNEKDKTEVYEIKREAIEQAEADKFTAIYNGNKSEETNP